MIGGTWLVDADNFGNFFWLRNRRNLSSMPEGTQRCSRTKMVLPLRVWLDENPHDHAAELAHTIDISSIGGRIGGLRSEVAPGQTITLQRGQHKAAFKVIWTKQLSQHENQAGLEAIDFERNIWGVELPESSVAPSFVTHHSTHDSVLPFASAAAASSTKLPIPIRQTSDKFVPVATHPRMRWGLSLALLLLSVALGLSLYHEIFSDSMRVALQLPAPHPPTAEELARMTPKARPALVPLAKPLDPSIARVQVAEAPQGRVIYPVTPEDTLGGKVRLQIVIAANGLVKQIHVLSGTQVLAQAAAQAVRLWHYSSFENSNGPTDRETSVTVSFRGRDAVSLEFPTAASQIQAN